MSTLFVDIYMVVNTLVVQVSLRRTLLELCAFVTAVNLRALVVDASGNSKGCYDDTAVRILLLIRGTIVNRTKYC